MKFQGLKSHFGDVKKAYLANKKELESVLGFKLAEKFIEFRQKFDPKKELEKLQKDRIKVLTVDDEDYPESLKNISDSPICIYVKSSAPKFFNGKQQAVKNLVPSLYFAIVGTRNPTNYGIQVARKFSYELAKAGFIIVSGLAYGVDTIAHQSCLDAGGRTIAVLGCGVNVVYPAANKRLSEEIIQTGGAIISEFPPNQYVLKGLFISRNRIISGLSRGILIAEGGEFSGSLITAKFAGIQGKDVFAVPSPINSDMSRAPNLLIKQGAKMVTTVEDIYDEFDMKITPRKKEDIKKNLNEVEKSVFDILSKNPLTVDDLAIELRKSVMEILNLISILEIKGVVEKNLEKKYQIKI
ncbi:MAG: DNA-processing protein DprA [Patescibacteria group bacterium]